MSSRGSSLNTFGVLALIVAALAGKAATVRKLEPVVNVDDEATAAIEKVMSYYQARLEEDEGAKAYLEQRGLSIETARRFGVGFCDRTLGLRLPLKNRDVGDRVRTSLMSVGILRKTGHEHFRGCLTVPLLDDKGSTAGVYGRRATERTSRGAAKHLYLPGPHRGVFNRERLQQGCKAVILCESVIDAMTFAEHGFDDVTCAYGTNGLTEEVQEAIIESGASKLFIAYDRDEAGDKAAELAAKLFSQAGLDCYRVQFPRGMDANEYALKVQPGAKSLDLVLRKAVLVSNGEGKKNAPVVDEKPTEEPAQPELTTTPEAQPLAASVVAEASTELNELRYAFGPRSYRARGLQRNTSLEVLKLNLLARKDAAFHVDTFDLYSAKHRAAFIKEAAKELSEEESTIKRDVGRVLLDLEARQEELVRGALEPEEGPEPMSLEERQAALALLKDPKLTARILDGFSSLGVVGEEDNKLIAYLAATSRKLKRPLAVIVQSSSSAGKTSLMDAVLSLIPDEERVKYSAMTGQALYYLGEEDLSHKVLAIAEEEGAEKATYALKLLQSDGELSIASTGKDPISGRLKTETYSVKGPVMMMLSTTRAILDEELENRCLVLSVSEDVEQTEAIHRAQRTRDLPSVVFADDDKANTLRLFQNAQRLLEPLIVVNPYADKLTFSARRTRSRRDHDKYLSLIKTVALLFQHQRKQKTARKDGRELSYIEVEPADIELAGRLFSTLQARRTDDLAPHTKRVLDQVQQLAGAIAEAEQMMPSEVRFSRRQVREHTGLSETQVRTHLGRLRALEYVVVHRGGPGQRMTYELAHGLAEDASGPIEGLTLDVTGASRPREPEPRGPSRSQAIVEKLSEAEALGETSRTLAATSRPLNIRLLRVNPKPWRKPRGLRPSTAPRRRKTRVVVVLLSDGRLHPRARRAAS